jgi:hypothetical protein
MATNRRLNRVIDRCGRGARNAGSGDYLCTWAAVWCLRLCTLGAVQRGHQRAGRKSSVTRPAWPELPQQQPAWQAGHHTAAPPPALSTPALPAQPTHSSSAAWLAPHSSAPKTIHDIPFAICLALPGRGKPQKKFETATAPAEPNHVRTLAIHPRTIGLAPCRVSAAMSAAQLLNPKAESRVRQVAIRSRRRRGEGGLLTGRVFTEAG